MRGYWWLPFAAACGSVTADNPDAGGNPDAALDGAQAAPGEYRWVRSLSAATGYGLADGPGGLVITGGITAPADLGGGILTPVGAFDIVIAGLATADAAHLYSVRHGDTGSEFAFASLTDAQGAPIVHGVSYGTVDLGMGQVAGGGGPGSDGYIGRYGPGAPAWVQRMVGSGEDKLVATALGTGSTVYGAGWFEGTTSFNGGTLSSSGGREIFLARFDTFTGAVDLTETYGSAGRDEASSLASAGADLVMAGFFDGTLAFGAPALPLTSAGGLDCYAVKLMADGNAVWAVRFGGSGDDRDPHVAIDPSGDVYVAGQFHDQVAFGAVNLTSNGGSDIFVAKLRGSDGNVIWATSFGSVADEGGGKLAVDDQGRVVVVASVGGPLDAQVSAGGIDAVIASLDASSGARRWRHIYSTSGDDRASTVLYGRDDDVYATIGLAGPYDFGTPMIGPADPVGVLLRIAP